MSASGVGAIACKGTGSTGFDLGMEEGKFCDEGVAGPGLVEGTRFSGCGGMAYADGWTMCAAMSARASISSSVI